MKIQVLGSGCPTCKTLFERTQQAAGEVGIKDEVEYITEIDKIVAMGVMSSPVLAVDGQPVIAGRLPSLEEIKVALIKNTDNK